MPMRTSLVALLLFAAAPASAECVYKNVYDHLTDEHVTVPFSCPPTEAGETPKLRNHHECLVHEERNAKTGDVRQVRSCA